MSNSFFTPGSYMNTTTLGQNLRVRSDISALRSRIMDAQNQLSSGYKTSTHGGLGANSTVAQELRHKLGRVEGYRNSISLSQSRLHTIQNGLGVVQDRTESLRNLAMNAWSPGTAQQIEQIRMEAPQQLASMTSALNSYHGGRYLFGGNEISSPPVLDSSTLIEGAGGKLGLRDVMARRLTADMGAGNDGRVSTNLAGSVLTITHDGGAFGLRLTGVSSATATVVDARETTPGTTTEGSVDIATLADGESVTVSFELPDGTATQVTMIASSVVPLPTSTAGNTHYFTTGNTASFETLFDAGVQAVVSADLTGASAMAAGNDFFDHQVPRIPDGGAGATGYTYSSTQAVSWYAGEKAVTTINGPATGPAVDSLKPGDLGDDGNAPPDTGESWIVDAGAVGSWAGHDGEVATFNGETWEFTKPEDGLRFIDSAGDMRIYDSTLATWRNEGQAEVQTSARNSVRSKVDDGFYVSAGARAEEDGVREALKNAAILSAAAYDEGNPDTYRQVARSVFLGQSDVITSVVSMRSEIGVSEERLIKLEEAHLDMRAMLNEQVMKIEGADEYELSTRLQDLMARLEASYQITSRLSQLSLTNYL